MPYPALNARVNAVNPAGRNVYTRAATHHLLPGSIAEKIFNKYSQAIQNQPKLKLSNLLFHYFHTEKVNSVDHDETSQNTRGSHGNMLINMIWEAEESSSKDEQNGMLDQAKKTIQSIRDELGVYGENAVAYGNAGMSPKSHIPLGGI